MKVLKRVFLIILFAQPTFAQESRFDEVFSEDSHQKIHVFVGTEISSLQTKSSTLTGYGARLGLNYSFTEKIGVGFYLGQVYGNGELGFSSLYTNLTASGHYAIQGSLIDTSKTVYVGYRKMVVRHAAKAPVWDVSFGAEQMLLNGTAQVFPATGFAIGTGKDFKIWDHWWKLSGRFSQLVSQSTTVTGIFINVSFEWPL